MRVEREYCCNISSLKEPSNSGRMAYEFSEVKKSKHTVLSSLATQQLCLSPPDGSTNSGLTFVIRGVLSAFFLMV